MCILFFVSWETIKLSGEVEGGGGGSGYGRSWQRGRNVIEIYYMEKFNKNLFKVRAKIKIQNFYATIYINFCLALLYHSLTIYQMIVILFSFNISFLFFAVFSP